MRAPAGNARHGGRAALARLVGFAGIALVMASANAQPVFPGESVRPLPSVRLATGEPVRIEDADRMLRARWSGVSRTGMPATRSAAAVAAMANAAAAGCGGALQPVEIATLAAALKCELDLIFEYVHDNIAYEPLFGSNKGALGTLLDRRGSDIDQTNLFLALLSAAGYAASQLNLQYGYIRLNGAAASAWLGVKDDGQAIANLIHGGGIPIATGSVVINADGTLASIDLAHVWVQVAIAGTNYVFDPSFKQHTLVAGLTGLGTILGYTQSAFLSDAGGTTDSVSVSGINRANVRNALVTYAGNLIDYIAATDPGWSLDQVAGGKRILPLAGSPLRQSALPYLSPSQPSGFPQNWGTTAPDAYRTCFTVSMPGVNPSPCGKASSQTIELFSDETYGRRITIFSTGSACAAPGGSCTPTLLIEGESPPNGQNTGTAENWGSPWAVNVMITHPYAGADQSATLTIKAGGSYLLGAAWGGFVGRGMVEKHRKLLAEARASGAASDSEAVLGESLAVVSYSWLAQYSAVQLLSDPLNRITTQYHHGVGIAGQTRIKAPGIDQGPYVDLPLNYLTAQPQTFTKSGLTAEFIGAFFTISGVRSSLESAVLEQTQALVPGMQAASTVRLVDINAAGGAKTFFADGTSSAGVAAYFGSIRPNLTSSYASADLDVIDHAISTNGQSTGKPTGSQALVPIAGDLAVGL